MEDTREDESNLVSNQAQSAFAAFSASARAQVGLGIDFESSEKLPTLVPVKRPATDEGGEAVDDTKGKKKKARTGKGRKAAEESADDEDDDWFDGVPRDKDKSKSSSKPAPARQPRRAQAAPKRDAGDSAPKSAKAKAEGSGRVKKDVADGLDWRQRANKVRKISSAKVSVELSEDIIRQFEDNAACLQLKVAVGDWPHSLGKAWRGSL